VSFHYGLRDCQSEAGPFAGALAGRVDAVETIEDAQQMFRWNLFSRIQVKRGRPSVFGERRPDQSPKWCWAATPS